ncbi:hypothetical protein RYX36_005134, partial [Vicia faba]
NDNARSRWRIIIGLWFATRRKPQYSHIYFFFHSSPTHYKLLCYTSSAKLHLEESDTDICLTPTQDKDYYPDV